MGKLRIYANAWHQRSAGQYYRLRAPMSALNKLGLAHTFCDDPFMDSSMRNEFLTMSDVQVHFLTAGKGIHAQTKKFTELRPALNGQMEMQYPPLIVFDMDDDIEAVNPLNPKFCTLGTRDADGNLLMPNDEIGIKFDDERRLHDPVSQPMSLPSEIGYSHADETSTPLYLWKRGQMTPNGTYDVARNVIQHAQVRKMAATAHAITVTSDALAEVARPWNKRVHVYPNSLLFDDNVKFDIRRGSDDVRVLWQGGYSHFPDFYPLRGAITEAAKRLPSIKWVVFGTMFNWIYEKIAPGRLEYHPWTDFQIFHMKLGTLAFDINLAPLSDTRFNRCKSAIKWYEAAALKIPTLAQRTGPYAAEMVDGETGLLFSEPREFAAKLEQLVRDPGLRERLGNNAYDWVREHRDAMKNAPRLLEWYDTTRREVWSLPRAA